jgi:transcriptional regulator with XRE-family HTH domain
VSGDVLRAARVLAHLSQRQLADAAGLHPKSVAYWERRGSRGHWHEVGFKLIIDALRVHGVILLTGEGEGVRRIASPGFTPPSSG